MDEDIQQELLILSQEVQAVGRCIGSKKLDLVGLVDLKNALTSHKKTLETYIKIQRDRYVA